MTEGAKAMPQNSITTTASLVAGYNSARNSISFTNTSNTASIYLDNMPIPGLTTSNGSIIIGPNTTVTFHTFLDGIAQVQDAWVAVATATATLVWKEFHGDSYPAVNLIKGI